MHDEDVILYKQTISVYQFIWIERSEELRICLIRWKWLSINYFTKKLFSRKCFTENNFQKNKGANPSAKAPRFARVGGGSFVVHSLPLAFCREVVFTTRTCDLPVRKEQPYPWLTEKYFTKGREKRETNTCKMTLFLVWSRKYFQLTNYFLLNKHPKMRKIFFRKSFSVNQTNPKWYLCLDSQVNT